MQLEGRMVVIKFFVGEISVYHFPASLSRRENEILKY